MRPRQNPVGPVQAVGGDVLRAGFDDQMRNVDVGGALEVALLAVEAQVDEVLHVLRAHLPWLDRSVEHGIQCTRFRPWRRLFAWIDSIERTHTELVLERPTMAAVIALLNRVRELLARP